MRRKLRGTTAVRQGKPVYDRWGGRIVAWEIFVSMLVCGGQEPVYAMMSSACAEEGPQAEITGLPDQGSMDRWGEKQGVMLIENAMRNIEDNTIARDDTEIEAVEWVNETKSCLRVRVQYREYPPDNYRHKEDWFFFLEGEDIRVLYVDYPSKDWENHSKDRYVWDACDFDAYFEDVTFDGQEDLVISLGQSGNKGDFIYAVYVYENGSYHYKPGFENIPNYQADEDKQVIRGWVIDSVSSSATYIYEYRNGDFEMISCEQYDTGIPGFNSTDTFP